MPHAEQGKGGNNQHIKDEDLIYMGASRAEEKGKQPLDWTETTNLSSQGKHTNFLMKM